MVICYWVNLPLSVYSTEIREDFQEGGKKQEYTCIFLEIHQTLSKTWERFLGKFSKNFLGEHPKNLPHFSARTHLLF